MPTSPITSRVKTHDLTAELYLPPGTTDPVERTRTRTAAEIASSLARIEKELQYLGYEIVTAPAIA
jgi:hypothetical protein